MPNGTTRFHVGARLLPPQVEVRTLGVMAEPIVSIDTSQIRQGKLDGL